MNTTLILCIGLGVCLIAMLFVIYNYIKIKHMEEGTDRMIKMSAIIREGANVFIKKEFTIISIVIVVLVVLFSLFIEKFSGLTYLLGALMSSIVCIMGMKSATYANVRTSNKARTSLNIGQTVKVALAGGSISGLAVQAMGLLGLLLVVLISGVSPQTNVELIGGAVNGNEGGGFVFIKSLLTNATIIRVTTYSLGCSTVAMFNRVAGGNYTKAADISADILGKIRNDLPEDDSRVPNVIADFIGDNVNDIAGNCSDLLESFVATMSASIIIAVSLIESDLKAFISLDLFKATYMFPLMLAAGGLLGCILGIFIVTVRKMGDNPSKELNLATYISAGLTLAICGLLSYLVFGNETYQLDKLGWKIGWASPWVSACLGIASGVAIGIITEYYTSADYKPTKTIAEYATEGEAFVVTKGDAVGSRSVLLPVLIIGISLVVSGILCGTYGIAIASLGMLSFVGTTVSIDAFGPIADNAGGLAESCHLDSEVRVITDKLDSVGNTTAAIGKGFAIGSAAFATVSLICAFTGLMAKNTTLGVPTIDDFTVIAGCIIGGALIEFFSAILTDNTIKSAKELADVGDKQLSDPKVLSGEKDPDYNELVRLATKSALHRMVIPSIIALAVPFVGGVFLGTKFVVGILLGSTIVAITRAIFMGNSGGAFDNAKKYIESGAIPGHGKGTAAHKAAVTGDTIGDTRKDVVGVALDIFIKMMSTVATTLFVVIEALNGLF